MSLQELEKQLGGRDVRFARHLLCDAAIVEIAFAPIIEIFGVIAHIKNAVPLHSIWLMDLEIKANAFHNVAHSKKSRAPLIAVIVASL